MSVTIVTHNAYWFQAAPTLWPEERAAARPEVIDRLVKLYAGLAPDLLCLQEVPDEQVAAELAGHLAMHFCFAPGGKLKAYGAAIFSKPDTGGLRNLTEQVGPAERTCLHAAIRGERRVLSVLAVHLPSNRYAPFEQAERQRVAELTAALDLAGEVDVVVGDFNSEPSSAPYRFMMERGFRDAAEMGNCTDRLTGAKHRVDYIWLGPRVATAFSGFRVLGPEGFAVELGGRKRMLSDHYPLLLELD
ncbi:MAG TPA: endonuclease/exonuclease/phosphatase family protein [Phycisphaerae bacterium]|nr:endonuclease/exonuclease/phosphatase family protein [Phycisphaerae bacterium]